MSQPNDPVLLTKSTPVGYLLATDIKKAMVSHSLNQHPVKGLTPHTREVTTFRRLLTFNNCTDAVEQGSVGTGFFQLLATLFQ